MYRGRKAPVYTQEVYYDVGQSLLIALLDYDLINPLSRLLRKKGDTLEAAVQKMRTDMLKNETRPSVGALKKKLGAGKKKKGATSKIDQMEIVLAKNQLDDMVEEKAAKKKKSATGAF